MTTKSETPKTFPLEKILNIGVIDWFKVNAAVARGSSYDLVGVHAEVHIPWDSTEKSLSLIGTFASMVPRDAEVVVNYNVKVSGAGSSSLRSFYAVASGTALIRKKR